MSQLLIRFVVGGLIVSIFAVLGDVLQPKSFAGLFGGAPSVALATLSLTLLADGSSYAAIESHSMIAGAIAFFFYASLVEWTLKKGKYKALTVTSLCIPLWFAIAGIIWLGWLR